MGDDDELPAEEHPLVQRREGREENRQRFRRNQRSAARTIITRSCAILTVMAMLALVWLLGSVYFYWMGWWVWWHYSEKPCDEPLGMWLLVTLVLPLCGWLLSCCPLYKFCRVCTMTTLHIGVLIFGIWILWHAKTCPKTNSHIFSFARLYLIFLSVSWTLAIAVPLIVVALVIYGMNAGWFDEINGADPGVINAIETVEFDPLLFASTDAADDTGPDQHCCICTADYRKGSRIKKTPCKHFFHEECLGRWLKVQVTCPLCRNDLQAATLGSNA